MSYDGLNISIHFTILYIIAFPGNTKHLSNICTMYAQRLRRWSNIVQMLYKCFVFTGLAADIACILPYLMSQAHILIPRDYIYKHPATLTICYLEIVGHGPTRL